jgi:hypothetical protein
MPYIHPRLKVWLDVGGVLATAAEAGAAQVQRSLHRRSGRAGYIRRPGADTPMWNSLAGELQTALRDYGAKVRLARYLGVPKQRVTDFLRGARRLPDAELTLRMLHWVAERRAGRDPAL